MSGWGSGEPWEGDRTTAGFWEDYSATEQTEDRKTGRSVSGATIQVRDAEGLNPQGHEDGEKMRDV